MFLKSIRSRLSLTYAIIALMVALILGAVLLFTMHYYFQGQEYVYLYNETQGLVELLSGYLQGTPNLPDATSTLQSLSFLTHTRIRLLNIQGQIVADSGSPSATQVNLVNNKTGNSQSASTNSTGSLIMITKSNTVPLGNTSSSPASVQQKASPSNPNEQTYTLSLPVNPSFYGRVFNSNLGTQNYTPSSLVVRQPIFSAIGAPLGFLELSEGPAFGGEIVNIVVNGWAISSGVAVLMAILAGWRFSRRISAPVVELTGITQRMASGDLSARAAENQAGEFGILGHSFNTMATQVEGTIIALRRFVADAAHELRTPLTALHTYLELVEREQTSPATPVQSIGQALEQVQRLEVLTNDLLDLSRLETGVNGAPLEDIPLSPFVREICEPYASQAEQDEVSFSLDLPSTELSVRGHSIQLRRALGNLLDNALKFTPSGGSITIRLFEKDGQACLSVEDSGIGIPTEDLPYIFNRFHRGRNATGYPGSGLGLAIVKAIAQANGGQVSAENANPGSRFTLHLPVC